MNRKLVLFVVSGLGVLISGIALAYTYKFSNGVLIQNDFYEDKLSFDEQKRFNQIRSQLQVPKSYGRLINVNAQSTKTTFWFESYDGTIRNVEIQVDEPIIIRRNGELNE